MEEAAWAERHLAAGTYARNYRRRLDNSTYLPLISEAEHLHHSTDDHEEAFRHLCMRLGVGDFDRVFSDESGSDR